MIQDGQGLIETVSLEHSLSIYKSEGKQQATLARHGVCHFDQHIYEQSRRCDEVHI